jgi:phosphoenolpyruvate-protein kinase (PTS system EI component)
MAGDPALADAVEEMVRVRGLPAADAIVAATTSLAEAIAAVDDELLAARADDVRSLGRRAARLVAGRAADALPDGDVVLIADDLGPGDVAELAAGLAGIALAGGGATAHAAIVARSLGIPMVTGLGAAVLEIADGAEVELDGSVGRLIVAPSAPRADAARRAMHARRADLQDHERGPAITRDGRRLGVLTNVASAAEVDVGLRGGAEGVGLLRTELSFLEAPDWPSERDHAEALEPILSRLGERPAIVRVLDFGADKSPPFVRGLAARGIELLLEHPEAFLLQLRAICACAQRHKDVRIMLPLVQSAAQVEAARELLRRAAHEAGLSALPPLGAMIETPAAVRAAAEIARRCEFLSIGTNDLSASVLGEDRFAMNGACAHDPRVLRCIAQTVAAGHAAGLRVEVCGEAASEPLTVPLLIGLRVDELSVGAARVAAVRQLVRGVDAAEAGVRARAALRLSAPEEVEALQSA